MAQDQAQLKLEIEQWREILNKRVGEEYNKDKVQAAGPVSNYLDHLICSWTRIENHKKCVK